MKRWTRLTTLVAAACLVGLLGVASGGPALAGVARAEGGEAAALTVDQPVADGAVFVAASDGTFDAVFSGRAGAGRTVSVTGPPDVAGGDSFGERFCEAVAADDGSWMCVAAQMPDFSGAVTVQAGDDTVVRSVSAVNPPKMDTPAGPPDSGGADGVFTELSQFVVTGLAADGAAVTVLLGGAVACATTADADGAWSCTLALDDSDAGPTTLSATQRPTYAAVTSSPSQPLAFDYRPAIVVVPIVPMGPIDPGLPTAPVVPGAPVQPSVPVQPGAPVQPSVPVQPAEPGVPLTPGVSAPPAAVPGAGAGSTTPGTGSSGASGTGSTAVYGGAGTGSAPGGPAGFFTLVGGTAGRVVPSSGSAAGGSATSGVPGTAGAAGTSGVGVGAGAGAGASAGTAPGAGGRSVRANDTDPRGAAGAGTITPVRVAGGSGSAQSGGASDADGSGRTDERDAALGTGTGSGFRWEGWATPTAFGSTLRTLATIPWGNPSFLLAASAVAAGFLLLLALPAELLQSTVRENYERIVPRGRPTGVRILRRVLALSAAVRRRLPQRILSGLSQAALLTTAAVVMAFADPSSGLDLRTVRLAFALTAVMFVVNYTAILVTHLHARRFPLAEATIVLRPLALLAVAASVLLSRFADIQPGLLFGLILGLQVGGRLRRAEEGRLVLSVTLALLALGGGSWLLYGVFSPGWLAEPNFENQLAAEVLSGITVETVTALVIALLPLAFLDGRAVFAWSRTVWAGLYALAATAFTVILLPLPTSWVEVPTLVSPVSIACAGFALFSLGVWLYFRLTQDRTSSAASVDLRETEPAGAPAGGLSRGLSRS